MSRSAKNWDAANSVSSISAAAGYDVSSRIRRGPASDCVRPAPQIGDRPVRVRALLPAREHDLQERFKRRIRHIMPGHALQYPACLLRVFQPQPRQRLRRQISVGCEGKSTHSLIVPGGKITDSNSS